MNYDKQLAIMEIRNHGLRYVDMDENSIIVTLPSNHIGAYEVLLSFVKAGHFSTMQCLCRIANLKSKHYLGLCLCNELNNEYRWTKFFIDEDDLYCRVDALLSQENFSDSLFTNLYLLTSNIDANFSKINEYSSGNLY